MWTHNFESWQEAISFSLPFRIKLTCQTLMKPSAQFRCLRIKQEPDKERKGSSALASPLCMGAVSRDVCLSRRNTPRAPPDLSRVRAWPCGANSTWRNIPLWHFAQMQEWCHAPWCHWGLNGTPSVPLAHRWILQSPMCTQNLAVSSQYPWHGTWGVLWGCFLLGYQASQMETIWRVRCSHCKSWSW